MSASDWGTLSQLCAFGGREVQLLTRASKQRGSWGKIMTCCSSIQVALCHAQYVLPRKRISSLGTLGCGWHKPMDASSVCTEAECHVAKGRRVGCGQAMRAAADY